MSKIPKTWTLLFLSLVVIGMCLLVFQVVTP